MTEDDADEILIMMSQLWWTGANIPGGTLKIWHKSLMDLEREITEECVKDLVKDHPFWPAISDFRSHYQSKLRQVQSQIKPIQRKYLPKEENVKRLRELRQNLRANR